MPISGPGRLGRHRSGQVLAANGSPAMDSSPTVAIVGAGPAGLMAAEVLAQAGAAVTVYDAMPSAGRKFLMAGKGGLNITHVEGFESFLSRYGARSHALAGFIHDFSPEILRHWAAELGIATFVGSSGRVFPNEMKAAPLLRAWLHRLRGSGVKFRMRHRWLGWTDQRLRFASPDGEKLIETDALVLALGGASWPQLGSDGAWTEPLAERGVTISPWQPANCGFETGWSDYFRERFAGEPLKSVALTFVGNDGLECRRLGEMTIADYGLEGGLIYTLSAPIRQQIAANAAAVVHLDLLPGLTVEEAGQRAGQARGKMSLSNHLRKRLGLGGVKMALLREVLSAAEINDPHRLAIAAKALPIRLSVARPLAEAISSAGGIDFAELDQGLMLRRLPGVFAAGEMLDWEAPTGGYLLTACLATGRAAGLGAATWLQAR
ncbi:TIGR03862 family flavoprotein [Methylomonas sp. LWB]|uniref:NAD(P)/FAD-dependent oxidoreductase n=2 Tax=unclassified Methylomonas TaxID=2608980 RepID=UPI002674899C|nr:TIGR03862 family flavoprotein [Methylomonas sp. LWB]